MSDDIGIFYAVELGKMKAQMLHIELLLQHGRVDDAKEIAIAAQKDLEQAESDRRREAGYE